MKSSKALLATLFAVTSFPLLAQQPSAADQPSNSPTQQSPSAAEPTQQGSEAASPTAPAIELSPVSGELIGKLDSKTAKTGDNVEIRTKTSVKTASGTEIPKGSKLVGHVLAAKPSGAGENSQVALEFDHIELKGGQNLPVHSQIQSIAPAGGSASASASAPAGGGGMSPAPAGGSSTANASGAEGRSAASAPQAASADPGAVPAANSAPPAGTIVAKTGNIAIATTSIPSVLLANNAPGQQDPRMAQASSILLGAKKDIQLEGGTQMVVGVAAASGAGQ
jgi:hypothetical protein